jgi:hypothetical protein
MEGALIQLLITVLILAIIIGIVYAVMQLILPHLPAPFGSIAMIILWGIIAIICILYILIPLIRMIPAAAH